MGAIYRARDTLLGRQICIKVILDEKSWSEEYRRKFAREARLMAKLDHKNIVKIFDFGINGNVWLAMEFLRGGPVSDATLPMPVEKVISLVRQMSSALKSCHDTGIAHCDIKPANIVDVNGRYVLIDFGLGFREGGDDPSLERTRVRPTGGTPPYAPPEQTVGQPTFASDIYSLGCTAFELVTGRRPFNDGGGSILALATAHANNIRPVAEAERDECPRWFSDLLRQMMAIDEKDRPTPGDVLKRVANKKESTKKKENVLIDESFYRIADLDLMTSIISEYNVSRVIADCEIAISCDLNLLRALNYRKRILVIDVDDTDEAISKYARYAKASGVDVLVGPVTIETLAAEIGR